jgi:maltooligosyltrehalose trehalohydrolase
MRAWYQALITLRRAYPELTTPGRSSMAVHCSEAEGLLTMRRGRIALLCNVSDSERQVKTGGPAPRLLLASDDTVAASAEEELRLPAVSCAVVLIPRRRG